jgi:signal transduction histidine kinase
MNTQPALAPVKFLLVDDLEDNLMALEALLERPNLVMLKASSGREALELLLKHEVALALIDVQMPEIDGFELAELMRGSERTRNVPIILVTAGVRDPQRVFKGYESGAVDFLFKPIDARVLRQKAETFFELYRQRQELSALTRELEETLRFNETFVAVVGHDLRNPLNVVTMGAESLLRALTDPALRKTAERVRSNGRRMVKLLDDLSDLARARLGGGIVISREPANLLAVVQKVVAEQRTTHPERRIELEFVGSFDGEWDVQRIEQILGNLLTNAIRHGLAGGSIDVALDGSNPEWVRVSVSNRGHIPPELMPQIFQPFRSGQRARHGSDGLGLGLYIVAKLVDAHGGSIDVSSDAESGTRFSLSLPRSGNDAAEALLASS